MSPIIDSHIHMYPPEVFTDPAGWGTAHREPWWTYCVAPPGRRTLQGWADVPRLLADMDRAGIEKCVMLGWYWEHQETCDLQNGWFIEWVRQHPDRLLGFATVQLGAGPKTLDQLQRALDAGLCGIGELFPQVQRFTFEDDVWSQLVGIAVERDVPINLHVSDPLAAAPSMPHPAPLKDFVNLAQRFPDAKFVLAHWGGGIPFYELNPKVRALLKNIYYDTAATPLLYDKRVFRSTVDLIGADRILFGTDYPLLCYPADSRETDFERQRAEAEETLTLEERELVMGGNLRRLLHLP
ncbi:MAG TPA: amidohydrolase family protein [Chthoniobacterales bacterium]